MPCGISVGNFSDQLESDLTHGRTVSGGTGGIQMPESALERTGKSSLRDTSSVPVVVLSTSARASGIGRYEPADTMAES